MDRIVPGSANLALGGEARVIELVEQEIAARGLGPGGRLPTEREFALRSGESRTTVRHALEALEAEGRVVRHVGRGTFIASPRQDGRRESRAVEATSPAEIMAVRLLIEPQMVKLAVVAATPTDFAEIDRCLRGGEEAAGYSDFEAWDAALHRALAEATHNGLLVQVCQMVGASRSQPLWGSLKRRSSTTERRDEYKQDHREIVAAVTERNAEAAQAAMRRHLLRVRTYILGE